MIAIVCVDLKNGMLFNNRRQSKDREVRNDILHMLKGKKLWMNNYSYGQFNNDKDDCIIEKVSVQKTENYIVDEDFLEKAGQGEYCFVETNDLSEAEIEQLILYRWDKVYPSDMKLSVNLEEWILVDNLELKGYSHKKITKEVYDKYEK